MESCLRNLTGNCVACGIGSLPSSNNPDDVILSTEISKQSTPNCKLGEGILDITDPNKNILDDVTPNTETSIDLQNNDSEKSNTELLD